jgi:uncharacterized integral membrane protein
LDAAFLDLAQAFILVFGGIVVFYALRAYNRIKSQAMLLLGIGFAFVTLGAVVAGVLFNFFTSDLTAVETFQASCQAIGFLVIVLSLAKAKG